MSRLSLAIDTGFPLLCSGIGQYHSNEPDPDKPNKALKPYITIDLPHIRALVDNPPTVAKPDSQWLIPSSLPSRNFKTQEQVGQFWLLWVDIDKNPHGLTKISEIVTKAVGESDYEIYTSRSATAENMKCRVLIPLDNPLTGHDWIIVQELLNNHFEDNGIEPDRASERPAQLLYLPNRGDVYDTISQRTGMYFNPPRTWARAINEREKELIVAAQELEAAKAQAMAKKGARASFDNISLIDAFNEQRPIQDILIQAGYSQRGNSFRHPHSESGSYSATVKDGRVHALSKMDALYTDTGAHDAFSAFCVLFHDGDQRQAMKDAGDNWLAIGCETFNQYQQRVWKEAKITTSPKQSPNKTTPMAKESTKAQTPFSMSTFSLRGQSEAMKTKMLTDQYVLNRIAILGQATVIYAKPNTGKTLLTIYMLIESIKAGRIVGRDVFYINADDDFKGLVHKIVLAEQYGFEMIAPGHNGFESEALMGYMRQMVDDDEARGKVIILDTLKKFTDLMNKKTGSEFMKRAREFVSNGGTLIMLAHTNKNRDADGKAVFGGTSDIVDDCDCVFILDEISKTDTVKQVVFENIKQRGDVARELDFTYSIEDGKSYQYRLDSITTPDKGQAEKAKEIKASNDAKAKDQPAINALLETIQSGVVLKTDLIKAAHEYSGISKPKLMAVLDRYNGKEWKESIGARNAKSYRLITSETNSIDYLRATQGY